MICECSDKGCTAHAGASNCEQVATADPHDVAEWKECSRCGKDYPITFNLDHCILHRDGKLVVKRRNLTRAGN